MWLSITGSSLIGVIGDLPKRSGSAGCQSILLSVIVIVYYGFDLLWYS